MKKIALVLLILNGCSTLRVSTPPAPMPMPMPMPEPIPPMSTTDGSGPKINILCDDTCTLEQANELPAIAKKITETERKQCFSNVFKNADHIDNSNGESVDKILNRILSAVISTSLTIFSTRNPWSKEDGFENGDGKVHANIRHYQYYNICDKSSLFGHEIAHILGYTHNGNLASGNELTVPYLVNAGFDACCLVP